MATSKSADNGALILTAGQGVTGVTGYFPIYAHTRAYTRGYG